MLSKEVKKAILNGAYGMTRDGRKVKYLGETINKSYPLGFITVPDKISHIKPYNGIDVIFSSEDMPLTWAANGQNFISQPSKFDVVAIKD